MDLGFVGLGAMGQLIVPRLMAAGHSVTGWNRSRDKAVTLLEAGMLWAETPREVAEQSELVFSIVTDSAAVKSVALGADGIVAGMRKGGVYIDMSTIEPEASRAVAAEFAKAGSIMLDAPLSGSPVTVVQGNASIMVGGDAVVFERVKPVLLAIGPKVTYIGGNGLACQMKIAVNLLLMVEDRTRWAGLPQFSKTFASGTTKITPHSVTSGGAPDSISSVVCPSGHTHW